MKIIYVIIFISFSLILMSCSSIYTEKNFSSKEKLYHNFNNSVKETPVNVTFINDSSVIFQNGAVIKNDTLYAYKYLVNVQEKKVNLSEIKSIDYAVNNYKSAVLFLKSGKKLKAENIQIGNDIIKFSIIDKVKVKQNIAALSKIKQASYKNKWLGVIPGVLIGVAVGIGVGLIIFSSTGAMQSSGVKHPYGIVLPPIFSLIAGITWGWISGYNYVYQFNK